jgi:hypothetical protein
MTAPLTRATLASALAGEASLSAWTIYPEPPEQLVGGLCIVVAPRSPYQSWATYGRVATSLTISLLAPRMGAPVMDAIDAGLAALRTFLSTLADVSIDDVVSVGILDEVGAVSYVVASLNIVCE